MPQDHVASAAARIFRFRKIVEARGSGAMERHRLREYLSLHGTLHFSP